MIYLNMYKCRDKSILDCCGAVWPTKFNPLQSVALITRTHCTLHAVHCTHHYTLHTAHCTSHTLHTLHATQCTLHTAHCTLHTMHTLHTLHSKLHKYKHTLDINELADVETTATIQNDLIIQKIYYYYPFEIIWIQKSYFTMGSDFALSLWAKVIQNSTSIEMIWIESAV